MYPRINEKILNDDPFAIDLNIIKSSIKYNDRFERIRLKTHSNHESDFQEKILKEGKSILNKRPYKKELKIEEAPVYKFMNTSAFFTEKLRDLGEEKAGQFINYLFNNVKIIRIDCQSVNFAIKLFQVLNDRGLDLSNSDLIKSFLIGKIHKKYEGDEQEKKRNEDQFMDDWKFCEQIAIDTEENMNNLFVIYEYFLLGKNPERSLYDELVKVFEKTDPNSVIADFKKFITKYKEDVYQREDSLMYSFWYIKWSMYWRTIVLTALHTDYKEYEDFLKVFRRYYYLNWIAGNTLTKIKQTSFNIIKWLKDNQPLPFIRRELENSLRELSNNSYERAIDNLNGDIYYEPWCKPLLFMIEYQQQDNPKFLGIWDKNIHVEHIIPQAYSKNKDWRNCEEIETIDEWINSGGNLTLLSGSKNISASNDGFLKKMVAYDSRGYYKANDDKVTSFIITQNIVNDFKAKKYSEEWNIDAINDRWVWFCKELESILDIDLSDNKKNIIKK